MSWLSIYGPSARIEAANQHIDDLARASNDPDDPRTLSERRADVAMDLLYGAGVTPEGELIPPVPINLHLIIDHTTNSSSSGSTGSGGVTGEVGRLGTVDADTLREFLDLAEDTGGVVDGTIATDQPCPRADVHETDGPGPYTPSEKLTKPSSGSSTGCVSSPAANANHGAATSTTPCATPKDRRVPATWPRFASTTTC